jgi:hypothetical protein
MSSITLSGRTVANVEPPVLSVYAKRYWSDGWTWLPWANVLSAGDHKGGSVMLQWHFGSIMRQGQMTAALWDFLNIGQCWVTVYATDRYGSSQLGTWWIRDEVVRPSGNANYPDGEQLITGVTLEQVLYQKPMLGSWAIAAASAQFIDRPLTFNDNGDPNMSPTAVATGDHYCFYTPAQADAAAAYWNNLAICDYGIGMFANGDGVGGYDGPVFLLTGFTAPLLDLAGTHATPDNVGDLLDAMINPARGIGWRVLTNGVGPIYIDVFSYFSDENADTNVIDLTDWRINDREIQFEHAETFDYIHYLGGYVQMCASFAVNDAACGPLIPAWSATQEAAYIAKYDDVIRAGTVYAAVYQLFEVDPAWDWMIGEFNCAPLPTWYGGLDYATQSAQATGIRKFLRTVPIYEAAADGAALEYRSPFVVVDVSIDEGATWQYMLVDKLKSLDLDSATVTPLDKSMGVRVEPGINHVAGLNWLDPDGEGETTETPPQYDYSTYYLTAAFELDCRLYVMLPVYHGRTPNEVPRVKRLEDPNCAISVIAPYTIVDVQPDALVDSGASVYYVRDDGARLWAKAMLAANFYGAQRATLNVKIEGVQFGFRPGSIIAGAIDAAGYTEVGTVVTGRVWDFVSLTTQITTGRVEADSFDSGARSAMRGMGGGGDWTSGTIISPTVVSGTYVRGVYE